MHLKIKDLKQNEFKIRVKPSDTILNVKEKIKSKCAEKYDPKEQKLVYLGVMLSDECTVDECEFDESDYVLLIHRPAGDAVENDSDENSATEKSTANEGGSKEECNVETLNKLVSMGYTHKMAKQALNASSNNAEVALKYLVNGIPDEIESHLRNSSESDSDEISCSKSLATLIPNFKTFCKIMRNNPIDLPKIMSDIALQDHSFYENMIENPHAFIDLLKIDDEKNNNDKCEQLGHKDRAALKRLELLGFDEDIVMQAYRACDLNETRTAEFLSALKK